MWAPAATPPASSNKFNREIAAILREPDTREQFLAQGAEAVGDDLAHFRDFVQSEHEKWAKVVPPQNCRWTEVMRMPEPHRLPASEAARRIANGDLTAEALAPPVWSAS